VTDQPAPDEAASDEAAPDEAAPDEAAVPAGKRVLKEPPEPPQADAVVPVTVGTALWAVAFLVLLAFRDRLAEADNSWWLAVCATGFALGLLGIWYVRRRREAYRRARRGL
jgi:hypothetical protein